MVDTRVRESWRRFPRAKERRDLLESGHFQRRRVHLDDKSRVQLGLKPVAHWHPSATGSTY